MKTVCAKYEDVCKEMLPGDLIAFGGTGCISYTIKTVTRSPVSHVGVILSNAIYCGIAFAMIAESTSLDDVDTIGVQFNRLSDRIKGYEGSVWWLPLADDVRATLNVPDLASFLVSQKGKKYDTYQAVMSAVDFIPDTDENLDRLFCSEYVVAAWEEGFKKNFTARTEFLRNINASEVTPADILKFDIYRGVYQLKGELKEL